MTTSISNAGAGRVRTGGALGIAGAIIGLLIFVVGCAGFDGSLMFSLLPVIMGGIGFLVALSGALCTKKLVIEDTHVLSALFVSFLAVAGGLLEMSVWLHWTVFYPAGT